MNQLKEHQWLFDKLVNTTYAAVIDNPITVSNIEINDFYLKLKVIVMKRKNNYIIPKEDIKQQLKLFWLIFDSSWRHQKPDCSYLRYIFVRSCWALRDWLWKEMKVLDKSDTISDQLWSDCGFKLDIKFLILGTNYSLLSKLKPYERYLLFLRFTQQQSLIEMAKTLQKSRQTISKQLNSIITNLRSV